MKLRNKKTGEIAECLSFEDCGSQLAMYVYDTATHYFYSSLAKLNEEWEDYDDTKDHWCVSFYGEAKRIGKYANSEDIAQCKEIGNYFETKEEAEKAVEKLKAWKRLEEAGFEFKKWKHKPLFSYHYGTVKQNDGYKIYIEAVSNKLTGYMQDLDLLFGGEDGRD